MMNFKIPEEYKDFVTDANDLLHQINGHNNGINNNQNNNNVNDNVTYYIYKDIKHDNDSNYTYNDSILTEYIDLYNTIIAIIQPLMKNYRWNYHSFHLTLKIDINHHYYHHQKQQQQQQQQHPRIYLYGSTSIGQCIDDEWFIVYLLLYISMKLHDINIHVMDNDGEFLLIEMADYLDDWVEPENSTNRVWLRNGKMHIIPYDEPGKLKDGSIALINALHYLSSLSSSASSTEVAAIASSSTSSTSSTKSAHRSSECNKNIQKILYNHTIYNYPARIFALHHNIIVILPQWIALFFQQYPQYIAKAIYYFHNYNNDKIKDILKLSLFNKMLNRITTTAKASSNDSTATTTTTSTTSIGSADVQSPLESQVPSPSLVVSSKHYSSSSSSSSSSSTISNNNPSEQQQHHHHHQKQQQQQQQQYDHEQHIIALSLPLTRLLYAQLNFKNFKIPRKYHNFMRRISLSSSRKVMKAFDFGCRLSCGLECMYYDSIKQEQNRNIHFSNSSSLASLASSLASSSLDDNDKDWISLVSTLQSLHYLQHSNSNNNNINNLDDDDIIYKLKQLYLQNNIILNSINKKEDKEEEVKVDEVKGRREDNFSVILENFCSNLLPITDRTTTTMYHTKTDGNSSSTTTTMTTSSTTSSMYGNMVYSNGNDKDDDKLLFDSIYKDHLIGDDDNWLYLTPDELDKELQDRMDRYTNNNHDHDHHHDNDNADSHYYHQQDHNSEHKMHHHQHKQQQQQQQQQQSNDSNNSEENTSNNNVIDTTKAVDNHDNGVIVVKSNNNKVDNNQLDSIIDGLKSFMNTKSDYDGVTSSLSSTSTMQQGSSFTKVIPTPQSSKSSSSTSSSSSLPSSILSSNIDAVKQSTTMKKVVSFNEMATATTSSTPTTFSPPSHRDINNGIRDNKSNMNIDTRKSIKAESDSSNSKSTSSGLKIDYNYLNRLMKEMDLNNNNNDMVDVFCDEKKYDNNDNNNNNMNDRSTADINDYDEDEDEDDGNDNDGNGQHDDASDSREHGVVDNNMKDFLTYFSNDDLKEFDGDSINDDDDGEDVDDDGDDDDVNDDDVDVDVKDYGFNPHFNSKDHQLHINDNINSCKTSHVNDASYIGKGNFIITTNEKESNKSKYIQHTDGNDPDSDDEDVDSDDEEEEDGDDIVMGDDNDDMKMIKYFQSMMDRELYSQSSALKETFEWIPKKSSSTTNSSAYNGDDDNDDDDGDDDDDEIDIDMSVLKNLIEAQSHQQLLGSPISGPLGKLLSQLGLQFPSPSSPSSK